MSDALVQILAAIAGTGTLSALITALLNRSKNRADVTDVISGAAAQMLDQLRAENSRLADQVTGLREQVDTLTSLVRDYARQLADLGIDVRDALDR